MVSEEDGTITDPPTSRDDDSQRRSPRSALDLGLRRVRIATTPLRGREGKGSCKSGSQRAGYVGTLSLRV